jgi:hypothetical protein
VERGLIGAAEYHRRCVAASEGTKNARPDGPSDFRFGGDYRARIAELRADSSSSSSQMVSRPADLGCGRASGGVGSGSGGSTLAAFAVQARDGRSGVGATNALRPAPQLGRNWMRDRPDGNGQHAPRK